jgi:hypothetical protein
VLSDPATVTLVALVATIVRVEALPTVIVLGFATTVTVGGVVGGAVTVTVAFAVAAVVPAAPFAVAVYVVVAAGLTTCVPPVAARL